jgi:predicted ATPase/class 3 adenylate cyclase
METPVVYVPMDRRHALARGAALPNRTTGAALFADISGFTPLTEALLRELGPQRGAEELTRYLNLVYDAVIEEVHRFGGSVIAFAGDAITCWFDGDAGRRAVACALAMQAAMAQFSAVSTPGGASVALAMKTAIAAGPVRRFLVGDPALRVLDALAGATLARLATAEHLAQRGETVVDGDLLPQLAGIATTGDLRIDGATGQHVCVVTGLEQSVPPAPWAPLAGGALKDEEVRPWLLPQVYARLRQGMGDFLAELRSTVALFVRFGGIDYDADEEAGAKLDAYIRWVQAVVARFDGTFVDLNIGDKGSYLYINFGAPQAHEDNAARAAAAALDIRTQPADLDFIGEVQIGISQGRMRAGAYGGANHRTYGVLGDEVNMAARLMMAARPGQILVSLAARRSMGAGFELEELPPLRVKGKREPAIVFALTGEQQRLGYHLAAVTYAAPMVGRERELVQVADALLLATQGKGQIISLVGEAGVGKSRLVAAVVQLASEHGFTLAGGECESYGINSAYLVWQPIWLGLFGLEPGWSPARQLQTLTDKVRLTDPLLLPRLPLLAALLRLEIPENDTTQSLDPRLRKSLLEAMVVDLLRAEAQRQPLLLVLEACQWLDPLSEELLAVVAAAMGTLPVVLLLTHRSSETELLRHAQINQLAWTTEIVLAPLSPAEAERFARTKLAQLTGSDEGVPATLIQRITRQADGNPFYIEELINYLHARGVNFRNSRALEQVELPDSLQRLVLSHVDQLSESQKVTVKVASVVGRVFRAAWLSGVWPELGNPERIGHDLEALRVQELMVREPAEAELIYLFRQVITQGVTYESLPHALKRTLHGQIGAFIEMSYPSALEQYLDLLAYHFDRSTNLEKAHHYLRLAGEAAQANYANLAAIDYYERLLLHLPAAEQGDVLLKLGQVFDTVGDYEQAHTRYLAALRLAETTENRQLLAQCQIALGELSRNQSRYDAAATYFLQSQEVSEAIGDEAGVAKALVCAGSLALYQGAYAAAQAYYTQSLAIRRRLDDQPNIAKVLNNMAITAANQGDFPGASLLFEQSLVIRRALHDKWGVANSLNNLGELAFLQQAYGDARTYLAEAVQLLREIGDKWSLGNALVTLGNVQRAQGERQSAYPLYQESLQINQELGDRRMLAYLLENLGALLVADDPAGALQLTAAAAGLRETLGAPLSPAELQQQENDLLPARRQLGEAAAAAWEAGRGMALEEALGVALAREGR